jgi:hypothetical protein
MLLTSTLRKDDFEELAADPRVPIKARDRFERDLEWSNQMRDRLRSDLQHARAIIAEKGPTELFAALDRGQLLPAVLSPLGLAAYYNSWRENRTDQEALERRPFLFREVPHDTQSALPLLLAHARNIAFLIGRANNAPHPAALDDDLRKQRKPASRSCST